MGLLSVVLAAALLAGAGWEPAVKGELETLVERNRGKPDAYAVFDFDHTIAIGDLTYVCMWRILDTLDFRFGDFKDCFAPGVPEDEQGEIAALAAIVAELEPLRGGDLTENPHWKDFTLRFWKLYRRLFKRFGSPYGCAWRNRIFNGYGPEDMAALARIAIRNEMARPGRRPDRTVPDEKRGLVIAEEMRELIRSLRAAGIDVYVVSGSSTPVLRVAAGADFGLDFPADHVFGRDSGVRVGEKPAFIRAHIAPRHHGAEPVLVAGDSWGDYEMFTEFGNLQAGLLFHRNWAEDKMWDLVESSEFPKGRILVQGRDEYRGVYVPFNRSVSADRKSGKISQSAGGGNRQ